MADDDCYCEETELDGEHTCLPCQNRQKGESVVYTSRQPSVPAQIADARTLAAHERELSGVGFTREELTAATAAQQKVAPTKAEILDAINTHMLGMRRERVVQVLRAVEKLFEERGL